MLLLHKHLFTYFHKVFWANFPKVLGQFCNIPGNILVNTPWKYSPLFYYILFCCVFTHNSNSIYVALRNSYQRLDEILIFFFSVSNAHTYNKCLLCEMCASIASAQAYSVRCASWIAFNVEGIYCMTEFSCKHLCWFPGWSAGKKI